MDYATNPGVHGRIALLVSEATLTGLTPGLRPLVGPGLDFGMIPPDEKPTRVLEILREWNAVGVIMEFHEELTELVASLGRPTVLILADMLMEQVGRVNVDDAAIGRLGAHYLWDKGLRQFGFCGRDLPHAPARKSGFLAALAHRGGEAEVFEYPDHLTGSMLSRGEQARLESWLEGLSKPVGVFAAHRPLARAVLEGCRRLALRIPEDVAVLSASGSGMDGELVYPAISHIELPWMEIARSSCQLIQRLASGDNHDLSLRIAPHGIRTRQSTDFYAVSDERIQKAVRFMQDHLDEGFDIARMVRAMGMERRTLERLFRRQLNRSPREVLTGMRLERARELLEQSRLQIGEIALRCGFGPSEKLASAFRQRYGVTPRQWRKEHRVSL